MKRILIPCTALALLLALEPTLMAGGSNKKKEELTIRIHGEANPVDGEKFSVPVVLLDGRKTSLAIMPLLSEHDIKSVYPFKAADGSCGAYLRLNPHGTDLLTQYSIENMGRNKILAVLVNGRQTADLIVDKPVRDGVFVIPSGMSMVEAAKLTVAYPEMGQENNPEQKKKKPPFSPKNIMLPPAASDLRNANAPAP
jgi:hypothetical protein